MKLVFVFFFFINKEERMKKSENVSKSLVIRIIIRILIIQEKWKTSPCPIIGSRLHKLQNSHPMGCTMSP